MLAGGTGTTLCFWRLARSTLPFTATSSFGATVYVVGLSAKFTTMQCLTPAVLCGVCRLRDTSTASQWPSTIGGKAWRVACCRLPSRPCTRTGACAACKLYACFFEPLLHFSRVYSLPTLQGGTAAAGGGHGKRGGHRAVRVTGLRAHCHPRRLLQTRPRRAAHGTEAVALIDVYYLRGSEEDNVRLVVIEERMYQVKS